MQPLTNKKLHYPDDQTLLEGLQWLRNDAFEQMYRAYFSLCSSYVCSNSGQESDAQDVFQEALIALVKKAKGGTLELSAKLETFLFAIVKRIWLNKLRKSGRFADIDNDLNEQEKSWTEDIDFGPPGGEKEQRLSQLEEKLSIMPSECFEVIYAFYYLDQSHREIADQYGYTEKYSRNKLYRCMEKLRTSLLDHG